MKVKTIYPAIIISAVFYVSEVWTLSKRIENGSNTGKEDADRNM